MSNIFKNNSNENKYTEIIFVIVISIIAANFLFFLMGESVRWTMYIFVAPIFLWGMTRMKNSVFQLSIVMFSLLFIEKNIIGKQTPFPFLRIGVSLILAIIAIYVFLNYKRKNYGLNKYSTLFFLILISLLVSVLVGSLQNYKLMLENVSILIEYYLEFFLFLYIGYLAFNKASEIKKFIFIIIVFAIFMALYHIIALTFGINIESIRGTVSTSRDLSSGVWRYGGFFKNVNNLCAFYVMFIPAAMLYLFYEKNNLKRTITGISIVIMLISLLFGGSRGGVAFVVFNCLVALKFLKINFKKIVYILFAIIIFYIVIYFFIGHYFQDLFSRSFERMYAKGLESPRYVIWGYCILILIDNPFGIGLVYQNYIEVLRKYNPIELFGQHSIYLEMSHQAGFLGLIIFLSLVSKILLANFRAFSKTDDINNKAVLAFLFVIISGFLIMGTTEPIFRNSPKLNHILGMIIGISISFSTRVLYKVKENVLLQ